MALPHDDQELLGRILHFCHGELLEHPAAQEALKLLGLAEATLLTSLSVGFARGELLRMLPEDEAVLSATKALGFIDAQGRDRFGRHLTVPLKSPKGHLAGYAAVDLDASSETLTLFEPFGCLYPQEIRSTKRACLTTSALTALLLAQAGEKAVLVAPAHGLTRHLSRLSEFSIREAILALDDGPLLDSCAQALAAQGIEPLAFAPPAGRSLQDLLRAGMGIDELLKRAAAVAVRHDKPEIERSEEAVHFTWADRSWRVRLLEPNRFDHLKVSVKFTKDHRWHLDTIDLSLARQRQAFIHMAKKVVRVEPAVLYQDLLAITEEAERIQAERVLATKKAAEAVSEEAKREAEEFLKDPRLFERLQEDFAGLGWAGDPLVPVIGYLALASRRLKRPLAVAWLQEENLPSLVEFLLPLLPEEDRVYLTRPSPKALLYHDEGVLKNRVVAVEGAAVSSETVSALARLARGQALRAQMVVRDPQTGQLKTTARQLEGPCALFLTVPAGGASEKLPGPPFLPLRFAREISEEKLLALDAREERVEPQDQARRQERILAKHRLIQRLLKPLAVDNPHADELRGREQSRLRYQRQMSLARAIAFLRQRQKAIDCQGDQELLRVDREDLTLAERFLGSLSDGGWLPPHAASQRVLAAILQQIRADLESSFTRTQIRGWTGLGHHAVREHLDRLEAEGYLERIEGDFGKAFRYRLGGLLRPDLRPPPGHSSNGQVPEPQRKDSSGVAADRSDLAMVAMGNHDG